MASEDHTQLDIHISKQVSSNHELQDSSNNAIRASGATCSSHEVAESSRHKLNYRESLQNDANKDVCSEADYHPVGLEHVNFPSLLQSEHDYTEKSCNPLAATSDGAVPYKVQDNYLAPIAPNNKEVVNNNDDC